MNKSDLLIALIRAEVCSAELEPEAIALVNDETLSEIYSLADHHDLAHFISAQLRKYNLISAGSEIDEKLKKQEMLAERW